MRPIWSGFIAFGLVNIPVKLYSPSVETGLDLDLLHKKDMSPIRYARICKEEEKEVPYDDVLHGYQYVKGEYVSLNEKDYEKANVRKTQTIEVQHFAAADEIDPNFFDKPYYLEPEPKTEKSYALLREALRKSGKVAVAKFVLRNREHLAIVRPHGEVLVLNQLRFNDQIKPADELVVPKVQAMAAGEMKMALELINKMTHHFRPELYKDVYIDELKEIIHQKAKGLVPKKKGEKPAATRMTDLMATLKASLEHSKVSAR